jgi:hypothetical protein
LLKTDFGANCRPTSDLRQFIRKLDDRCQVYLASGAKHASSNQSFLRQSVVGFNLNREHSRRSSNISPLPAPAMDIAGPPASCRSVTNNRTSNSISRSMPPRSIAVSSKYGLDPRYQRGSERAWRPFASRYGGDQCPIARNRYCQGPRVARPRELPIFSRNLNAPSRLGISRQRRRMGKLLRRPVCWPQE